MTQNQNYVNHWFHIITSAFILLQSVFLAEEYEENLRLQKW